MEKLKRVVIKEEFVALTGDHIKAILLNQFIYWSQRVNDFDKYIQEEKQRAEQNGDELNIELSNGWIYKKAEELSEEVMLGASSATIGRHLKVLIENGWLEQRQNPKYKWDQTKQYRVNLSKIVVDLLKLGYILQDYKVDLSFFIFKNADFKMKIGDIDLKNGDVKMKNRAIENEKAIPETIYRDYNKEKDNEFNKEPYPFVGFNWLESKPEKN